MSNTAKPEVLEDFGTVGKTAKGDEKRFIKVSWNGHTPVYEVRICDPDGTPKNWKRPGMSLDEVLTLREILNKEF